MEWAKVKIIKGLNSKIRSLLSASNIFQICEGFSFQFSRPVLDYKLLLSISVGFFPLCDDTTNSVCASCLPHPWHADKTNRNLQFSRLRLMADVSSASGPGSLKAQMKAWPILTGSWRSSAGRTWRRAGERSASDGAAGAGVAFDVSTSSVLQRRCPIRGLYPHAALSALW